MRKMLFGFGLLLVVTFLSSCRFETACTADFRFVTMRVEDEMRQPISGVKVTVTLERTGEILATGREQQSGSYVIVDDSLREKFSRNKDVLAVVGSKDDKGFQIQFEIRDTSCHIEKISGPDMVILK